MSDSDESSESLAVEVEQVRVIDIFAHIALIRRPLEESFERITSVTSFLFPCLV